MFIIQFLSKLIKILRSAASPAQIAGGLMLGMILGLTPLFTVHNLFIFIVIIILNVNIAMAIFSFGIFSGIAYLFDPVFHNLGYYLLVDVPSLQATWTSLYNIPVVALSRYNNTVVMGSLVTALVLMIPVYFLSKTGVIQYREKIDARIQKLKIVQALKSTAIYNFYEKIKAWGE
jgi:uncharacterized protein (TIGR03546 family)